MSARAALALCVAVAALQAACSDNDTESTTATGTTTAGATSASSGAGGSSACDGAGDCVACQTCAYDVGGPCEPEVEACTGTAACVELNECMTACVDADGTNFDVCLNGCAADHPAGAPAYDAVLTCVADRACPTACAF
jgi:hypothetical protein